MDSALCTLAMIGEIMYAKSGNSFKPIDSGVLVDTVPAGVYTLASTMFGFELQKASDFEVPSKIYGRFEEKADRILNTFIQRPTSTGVLLAGEAGSGKTMLGRQISLKGIERGMITILVNEAQYGDNFNSFIMSIEQPAIIFFDEFEKTFDPYEQDMVLTLLDGVCTSKKLYILTCNDIKRINSHMINRPGRLYYALNFSYLDKDFIIDYCHAELIDQSQVNSVVKIATDHGSFSFDMLKALVEEMNRYSEPASKSIQMLNIKDW